MPDRSDLPRIQALYSENADITQALAAFDAGGRIINMTVARLDDAAPWPAEEGGEIGVEQAGAVTVDTSTWTYPPEMVEAIKRNLTARQETIKQELINFGIGGIQLGTEPAAAKKG